MHPLIYVPRRSIIPARAPRSCGCACAVGFGSPPPWTPAALGATVLEWLEADSGVTTSGGYVTNVVARGSAAKDLAQAAGVFQPAWVASGASGILRFDGAADFMKTAAFASPLAQPVHHFIACKATQTEGFDTLFDGLTTSKAHSVYTSTLGSNALYCSAGTGSSISGVYTDGAWMILDVVFAGAASKLAVNGGSQKVRDFGAQTLDGLTIGARRDLALTIGLDWYAHIILSGDNSGAVRTQMIDYLRRKLTAAGVTPP